jgi:hypothetical protein
MYIARTILLGIACAFFCSGDSQSTKVETLAAPSPQRTVLNRYCVGCHNEKLSSVVMVLSTLNIEKAAFLLAAQNGFGTSGRNVVMKPRFANLDASLQKQVNLSEKLNLQLRFNAYDVFTHRNSDLLGRIFGASNFGVISSAERSVAIFNLL